MSWFLSPEIDITEKLSDRIRPINIAFRIENIANIIAFVNEKLPIKIPVEPQFFSDSCSDYLEIQKSGEFHRIFSFNNVAREVFDDLDKIDSNEASKVMYWDLIIRITLEEYFRLKKTRFCVQRGISRICKNYRADILFHTANGHLIFEGEERATNSEFEEAKDDLIENYWPCQFYSDFSLCYAAAGSLFQLFLLTEREGRLIPIYPRGDTPIDLKFKKNRIKVVSRCHCVL